MTFVRNKARLWGRARLGSKQHVAIQAFVKNLKCKLFRFGCIRFFLFAVSLWRVLFFLVFLLFCSCLFSWGVVKYCSGRVFLFGGGPVSYPYSPGIIRSSFVCWRTRHVFGKSKTKRFLVLVWLHRLCCIFARASLPRALPPAVIIFFMVVNSY